MQPNRNGTSMTNRLNRSRPTKAALAVAADITQEVTDCFRRASWAGAYGLSFGLTSSAREPRFLLGLATQKPEFCSQKERLGKRQWDPENTFQLAELGFAPACPRSKSWMATCEGRQQQE